MSLFLQLRRLWWKLPPAIREFGPLVRFKSQIKGNLATHDEIYTAAYYAERRAGAQVSASIIALSIAQTFKPTDVLDVGAGTGDLVQALRNLNINATGLEYSDAALAVCKTQNIPVQKFDLEHDSLPAGIIPDVVISAEVAEHLPASCADRYVDCLCRARRAVIFTAATPGQGGTDHVNEQPNDYWIAKFTARGFILDPNLTAQWRRAWQSAGALDHYYKNLMIFTRPDVEDSTTSA
jgi:SAM-dependent methyltransferase